MDIFQGHYSAYPDMVGQRKERSKDDEKKYNKTLVVAK